MGMRTMDAPLRPPQVCRIPYHESGIVAGGAQDFCDWPRGSILGAHRNRPRFLTESDSLTAPELARLI